MEDKFTGRCPHGNIPGSCEECNPPLSLDQVLENVTVFLDELNDMDIVLDDDIDYMDLCNRVEVRHLDGSEVYFNNALLREEENDWFTIHTEHLGNMRLNKGDCEHIAIDGKIIYKEKFNEC
jgi:hypothetical protein